MKMFLFETTPADDSESDEYVIFARNHARASELFAIFLSHSDRLPPEFSGEDFEKYDLSGTRKQLRDALASNVEGLGCYDAANGWTIIPPHFTDDPGPDRS